MMTKTGKLLIAAGAVSAVLIAAGVATAGPGGWGPGWMYGGWQGGPAMMQQGNGYGPGMMQGGGYGRGMMQGGGYGRGMMQGGGYGRGMMQGGMMQGGGYGRGMMQGAGYGRGMMQGGGAQPNMGWAFGDTAKMLDDAKAKLAIRAEQEEAWKSYTQTVTAVAEGRKAWRESMSTQNMAQMTAQERTEFMNSVRTTRTQEFQDIAKAQEALFGALDAPQKQVAASLLVGAGMQTSQYGRGMRGGRGRMGGGCPRW